MSILMRFLSLVIVCAQPISGWNTKLLGTSDLDSINAVAADNGGCGLYVGGSTWGVLAGAANAGLDDAFITRYSSTGAVAWTVQLGTSGHDAILGLAVDEAHNVYAVGETEGQMPGSADPALGGGDLFLAKYDQNGVQQWLRQLGTSGYDSGLAVAVGKAGNVFVAGLVSGDPGSGGYRGLWDALLAKYDDAGNLLFTRLYGTPADDVGTALAIGPAGSVYLVGHTRDDMIAYNAPGTTSDFWHGGRDLYVLKVDAGDGDIVWIRQRGTTADDSANGVAVNADNQVYVAGSAGASLDGEPWFGSTDLVVLRYETDGTRGWTDQRGTAGGDSASGVALDDSGTPFVSGFVTGSLEGQPFAGSADAVLLKYGKAGALRWVRQSGTSAWDSGLGVAAFLDDPFLVGVTGGNLGGVTNAGFQDGFVSRYSQAGALF